MPGHFAELGIVAPQGARNVRQLIAILEDERHSPQAVRTALTPLAAVLIEIEGQIAKLDKALLAAHRNNDVSIRLATVPGIGPVIATCLSASVSDPKLFEGGREFAAWLGLVPGSIRPVANQGWAPFPKRTTGTCANSSWLGRTQPSTG